MQRPEDKLSKLIAKLDAPHLDDTDIKSLALALITDVEGTTANDARVKLEAVRLLHQVLVKEREAAAAAAERSAQRAALHLARTPPPSASVEDNILGLLAGRRADRVKRSN
jgi:hypothetical protein